MKRTDFTVTDGNTRSGLLNQIKNQLIEITLTPEFQAIMKRWGVKLRPQPIKVRHMTYETETKCSPSVYAAYEVAIKTQYVVHFISCSRKGDPKEMMGCCAWFQSSLPVGDLPWVTDEMIADDELIDVAQDHFNEASKLICEAGLYYDLLD